MTHKPKYHGGYDLNAVYELRRDLIYDGRGVGDYFYWPGISCGSRVDYGQFAKSQADYPGIIIIPKGTRFRFIKMELSDNPWTTTSEHLTGKFVDGPIPSKSFDLARISTCFTDEHWHPRKTEKMRSYDVTLFWPDPKFVKVMPP